MILMEKGKEKRTIKKNILDASLSLVRESTVMVEGSSVVSTRPWFMGDFFLGYVMLKETLPLGPLVFETCGGGGVNWNASLPPLEAVIAGGSFGFTVSKISLSVDFLFRDIKSALAMSGSYDHRAGADTILFRVALLWLQVYHPVQKCYKECSSDNVPYCNRNKISEYESAPVQIAQLVS